MIEGDCNNILNEHFLKETQKVIHYQVTCVLVSLTC